MAIGEIMPQMRPGCGDCLAIRQRAHILPDDLQ